MLTRQRIEAAATQLSGCGCQPRLASISNAGRIGAYQRIVGVRHALSGLGQERVPALLPISDKKAVEAAVKLFVARRGPSAIPMRHVPTVLSGLGAQARVQSTASYASTGATVGSVIPVVGTVIGAVVGAVVGFIMGKSKPVRASAAEVAQCKNLLNEYMGFAAQSPNAPIPIDRTQLRNLNWCMDAIYGGHYIGVKDPRWFDPDVEGVFIPMAKDVVRKIYETPVGGQVNIDAISFKDIKGRSINFKGFSFINPVFTDLKTFTERYFGPMAVQMCKETAGKGAPGCEAYYGQLPEFKRWLYDLLAWAARETLPNISEGDLKAASEVAATIPNTSARDVVSAVESILNRSVIKDETAALLTTASVTPPPSTAPPNTPAIISVPAAGGAAPVINLPPTIAPVNPAVEPPVSNSPSTLTPEPPNPFLNLPTMTSGGGSSYLPSPQGQKSPGVPPMTAGIGGTPALWIAGGLAIAGVLFATARPAKRART